MTLAGAVGPSVPADVAGLAVSGTSLFYASYSGTTVHSVPLSGGTPSPFASGQNRPFDVAIYGANLYWSNYQSGAIASKPLAGGAVSAVSSSPGFATWIAVDTANVYWLDGNVNKAVRTGGPAVVLSVAHSLHLVGLAVDAQYVYWGDTDLGVIRKAPIAGGAEVTLASGSYAPADLAVDGTYVYWTDSDAVMKIPITGGSVTTVASGLNAPRGIAVDATHVYVASYGDAAILQMPK